MSLKIIRTIFVLINLINSIITFQLRTISSLINFFFQFLFVIFFLECNSDKWGVNCINNCTCLRGKCNPITGECLCPQGWFGKMYVFTFN